MWRIALEIWASGLNHNESRADLTLDPFTQEQAFPGGLFLYFVEIFIADICHPRKKGSGQGPSPLWRECLTRCLKSLEPDIDIEIKVIAFIRLCHIIIRINFNLQFSILRS